MSCQNLIRGCWFPLASILVFLVTLKAQEYSLYPKFDNLKMCIEDHLTKDPYLKIGVTVRNISEIVANRFSSKSFTSIQFTRAVENTFYFIKTAKSFLFKYNKAPMHLRTSIRQALKDCIERKNLPRFDQEPLVLADLLDFILVDWPTSLHGMIRTQNGRSTLRIYAYSAGVKLMSALRYFSVDYDAFHRELKRIWIHRAQQFYDDRDKEVPYFRHRFTTDRDRMYSSIPLQDIYTIDDVNSLSLCRVKNFVFQCSVSDVESFERYDRGFNVSTAENYLESHIDQCYRIIMFILELQYRGISTDEDDVYDGIIPSDVVPLYSQDIVWNSVAYKKYLRVWRKNLQQFPGGEVQESFHREDIIMQLSLMIIEKRSSTVPSSTSTTTTTTTTTEFPDFHVGSKKGGVRERDCGKYFLPKKRSKTMFSDQKQKFSPAGNNSNHYGYIVYHDDSKRLKKFDQLTCLKILAGLGLVIREISSH